MFDARRKQNAIGCSATSLRELYFSLEIYRVVKDQFVRFHIFASAPAVSRPAMV
jgi:hypothetical protein